MTYLKKSIKFLVIIFSLYILGCATLDTSESQITKLEMASALKFWDIPAPVGFQLIPNESFTFQSDDFRVGLLKYFGRASADQVINFYKEQMPLFHWNSLNIVEYARKVLSFEKEDELCTVTVEPKGKKAFIIVTISPKSAPVKQGSKQIIK